MRILVIQTASIGDVILATPVLEKLHHTFPDAAIDLLVKKGNESLFNGHPFLREVIVRDKLAGTAGFIRILAKIRRSRYDLVLNLQRFFKTGLLTGFSGAKNTIGFDKNPLSFLYTRRIQHTLDGIHEVDRNLALIADLAGPGRVKPRLYPSIADTDAIRSFTTGMWYTISPASLWFTKQFPEEKWIELVRLIPADASVYLLGSPGDRALCERIRTGSGHPKAVSLAGKLTLLQSAALMRNAWMNFTNDSAPMHLAASVNARVTAIYCSTIPGFGFGPLSDDAAVIETPESLPCRPCGLHGLNACPKKHFRCATTIEAAQFAGRL